MKWLGIMFMAALLAIAPGYGSAQQPKDTPPATQPQSPEVKGEAAGTAKSFTPAERQAYEKKTAADLDEMEQRIGELVLKVNRLCRKKAPGYQGYAGAAGSGPERPEPVGRPGKSPRRYLGRVKDRDG